jgi:Trp operon repressor
MAMISKNLLDEETLEKLLNLFFEVMGKSKDKNEFRQITNNILSLTERIMIAKRIAIIYLLTKKIDYKIICEVLKVSASTVFKFRFFLQENSQTTTVVNKILRNEKITDFLEEIVLTLYAPGTPGISWSQARVDKFKFEQKKIKGI